MAAVDLIAVAKGLYTNGIDGAVDVEPGAMTCKYDITEFDAGNLSHGFMRKSRVQALSANYLARLSVVLANNLALQD
jgi:hypothetical protein